MLKGLLAHSAPTALLLALAIDAWFGDPPRLYRRVPHPVYGKMVTRTKRLKAHDEENSAKQGDTVRIMETRPLSKDKRWRVVEIVERAR